MKKLKLGYSCISVILIIALVIGVIIYRGNFWKEEKIKLDSNYNELFQNEYILYKDYPTEMVCFLLY